MKKTILAMIAAVSLGTPVFADPITEDEFFTPRNARGACCSKNVPIMFKNLKVSDLNKNEELADIDYSIVADEFNSLVRSLNKVGQVF